MIKIAPAAVLTGLLLALGSPAAAQDIEAEGQVDTELCEPGARQHVRIEVEDDDDVNRIGRAVEVDQDVDIDVDADADRDNALLTRAGMELQLGGGVESFTGDIMRHTTDIAGGWGARIGVGTRQWVGGEVAYMGTSGDIEAIGLDPDAYLLSNGGTGSLRLNLTRNMMVQPFLLAGAGFRRFNLQAENFNTSAVEGDTDTVAEFPLGAGLALRRRMFVLDLRFTGNVTTQGDLVQNARMHRVNGQANLGFEF